MSDSELLNESQQRRLRASAEHIDELLSRIEEILTAAGSKAAFPKYHPDVSECQTRLIRNHIARFRTHLVRVLEALELRHEGAQFGALHSIQVSLQFVRISVQEMAPGYLRGYGNLSPQTETLLQGLCSELEGILNPLERSLALGDEGDLQARLDRLQRTTRESELLGLLDRISSEHQLAEFRPSLFNLLEKIESRRFEIAVFGRVSSGKSSLLNQVLHTDVLPVGVNPITSVPTRIVFGEKGFLEVTLADRKPRRSPLGDLEQYASEEQNPGNQLGVRRLVVSLPSSRLEAGLVLVDTPGLGALAREGAAETLAYLPQCDLGIVLVSAASPISDEDLNTLAALARAGIPARVLLSKVDLLSSRDLDKAVTYTRQAIADELGLRLDVHPVSTLPGRETLLEDWFHSELEPLYQRHGELSQSSLRRKVGALREAVIAALRSKLGSSTLASASDGTRLVEIESRLRQAAGSQQEVRRFCHSAIEEVRMLGGIALEKAATSLAESWRRSRAFPESRNLVLETLCEVAADAASQISRPLRLLAERFESALTLAAAELGGESGEDSLEDCLREMPRFEISLPEIDGNASWYFIFGALLRPWLEWGLKRRIQPQVDEAFVRYARSLESWSSRALSLLQSRFDTRADNYRAQLTRLTSTQRVSPEERERISSDIACLVDFTHECKEF